MSEVVCTCGLPASAAVHQPEPELEGYHAFVEKPQVRWFALVDEKPGAKIPGQLVDMERRECLASQHVRSPGKFPVPVNCDLAVKRYRLFKKPNGREIFVPIHHERDAGAENLRKPESPQVLVARAILELAANGALKDQTSEAITEFLNSVDARGSFDDGA